MKRLITLLLLGLTWDVSAQKSLFRTYEDSALLVQDANRMIGEFAASLDASHRGFDSLPLAVLNTQPFLIFYSSKSNRVNLPIWEQVIPEQKAFFTELGGSEKRGKKLFGLFFNGFYLPHELGHALQHAAGVKDPDLYRNEYFANTVAMLYWKKAKRQRELRQCYHFAKRMIRQLPNPAPEGEDPIRYFNEHYLELGANPYQYGYYQFAQWVAIYEDSSLGDFEGFIRAFWENSGK